MTKKIPTLESRMILHRFMCKQFGFENLREMLNCIVADEYQNENDDEASYVNSLVGWIQSAPCDASLATEHLARYDRNITALSDDLGMTVDNHKKWKPFQYLALLFTEHYLDLYFSDTEALLDVLNEFKVSDVASDVSDYTINDLSTLAFQSATGSGKTLILHANIKQYLHYLDEYHRLDKLNKIILVTPDEGLSRQHLREMQRSHGIAARLFTDGDDDYFSHGGKIVDIIDLNKLHEKKGIKRVALEAFEENNLVLVDEGHLGASGKVWRERRKQLAENGFTFEYSATFNQAVAGNDATDLRDSYGKSILFDYSYKHFYADGYGKDYKISNLQNSDDGEANNLYLSACLLQFYQQCVVHADKKGQWQEFNLSPPLWVFLGKTVTGYSDGAKQTESDITRIVKFIDWAINNSERMVANIQQLIGDNSGLRDVNGINIFTNSFSYLKDRCHKSIYDDICQKVFNGQGQLHISHLTAAGELHMRCGDGQPFGVINVGDASGLYTKLQAVDNPGYSLAKNEGFTDPLFDDVDRDDSTVRIVIGARRFAGGWNSWRVSTMGLMHVGQGEGPQIIQMFGRGVRLKGHAMSLKRHTALDGIKPPSDSQELKLLETLNIFGLKANYMEQFRSYLETDGVRVDTIIPLPVTNNFGNVKGLKILKKRDGIGEFQYSAVRVDLFESLEDPVSVTLNRYSKIHALESKGVQLSPDDDSKNEPFQLQPWHIALLDKRAVYHKVLKHKQRSPWHNMTISQKAVNCLLEDHDQEWYQLYIPAEKLEASSYGRVREWENLAADLICEYANRYWRRQRNAWEHEHLELVPLDDGNENYFKQYELSVVANHPSCVKEERLISDVENMSKDIKSGKYENMKLEVLMPNFHAYRPLLYATAGVDGPVRVSPVALNKGEAQFVEYLTRLVTENEKPAELMNKRIYLMRNLSRGKGVSFFDDYSFYPDFILWLTDEHRQDILFVDPKGLSRVNHKVRRKIKLHKKIKDTQKKVREQDSSLYLHSYIWSVTSPQQMGTDEKMTEGDCQKQGIYLASQKEQGLRKLLHHALHSDD